MQSRSFLVALVAAAMSLLAPAVAAAEPVTVNLRIEGATSTLFEGPVTTDVRTFRFTQGSDTSEHQCDGSTTGGTSSVPVPTRAAVVAAASEQVPFATEGSFHPQYGVSFTRIAGESVDYDPATFRYLVEYENWQFASLGACADDAQNGDETLFAYGTGSEVLLKLTAPATAKPGEPVTVTVVNGATGAPIAGAQVGGVTTNDAGQAALPGYPDRGDHDLKATKSGEFIRSNRARVCVTDGADGFCGTTRPGETPAPAPPCETTGSDGRCGTPDRTGPLSTILGLTDKQVFSRSGAPRELKGTVREFSGIASVQLRLTRRYRNHCSYLSGPKDRFVNVRCGTSYSFEVGKGAEWSYLLPSRLGPGRYVLDVIGIDRFGNRSPLARGTSRVTWTVR
jgi:hypothetical protein